MEQKPNRFSGEKTPYLVITLKDGWLYKPSRRIFVSSYGQKKYVPNELPKGSKIVYVAPALSRAVRESLSKDKRNLAKYLHLILPKGTDPLTYLTIVRTWVCVEEVRLPPDISLP